MGIQGLLAFLRNSDENVSAIKPSHLSKFRGKKAAVDAYCWLHKAVFTCAQDLFLNKSTTRYIDYCLKNLKLLQDNYITPILVFDGGRMPFKVVEKKRREDRQRAKKQADDLIAAGRMNEAFSQMVQSINITHEMASNLIKAARQIGIESVVAPYEADAQLVYLEKEGLVDFIISEDSDLIIFGAKQVFMKMSATGHGEAFDYDKIEDCLKANKKLKGKFTFQKLLYSAILSGCDYLKNIPGVGLIKAWKFMNMTENTNAREFLKKIPSYLKLSVTIDDEYIENFILAHLAFKYQLVFDTRNKRRVPLHSLEDDISKEDYENFLSRFSSTELDHFKLALGNIDNKNNHFDDYTPHMNSYLFGGFEQKTIVESPKPINGFNVDGAYKRTRNSSIRKSVNEEIKVEDEDNDDRDLANYYKNLNTSPVISLVKKEETIEQPRKRIKCKFLKYKPKTEDFEPVQSRFFKSKNDSMKTDDEQEENTKNIDQGGKVKEEITKTPIKEDNKQRTNFIDTPTKQNNLTDTPTMKQQNNLIETPIKKHYGNKDDDNDIPKENIKLNQEDEAQMRKIFADAGVEIDSENSNDAQDFIKQEVVQVPVTPVKHVIDIEKTQSPESPVIKTQVEQAKTKLKEIQNVQKFAKSKKKVLPKNQPTLLGFFSKLH